MDNTSGVKVGIIGGRDTTVELRKVINDIMYLASKNEASKVDVVLIKEKLDANNTEEFIDNYLKLSDEEKEALVKDSIIEVKVDEPHLLNLNFNDTIQYIHSNNAENRYISELNRRLKYEKNMFTKQSLQREIGSANAFGGKHAKGCKRKRKKK